MKSKLERRRYINQDITGKERKIHSLQREELRQSQTHVWLSAGITEIIWPRLWKKLDWMILTMSLNI